MGSRFMSGKCDLVGVFVIARPLGEQRRGPDYALGAAAAKLAGL